ncbi:hypothetical protein K1719_021726 [Acacia pycnantha]|nr:hypothetical protein K1719_021726 [Acacia pycnantha]
MYGLYLILLKLKKLENLELDGTQIIHLPEEIQELTNLQSLFLCFYEYRGRKGKQYTCSTIIPSEVLSKLKSLKHLSIEVNPDDERWYENVRDILPEILGLEHLLTLSLYIPHLELLKSIPNSIFQVDFKFIVGRHMERIISSTTSTCEEKFKQSVCSLKFVNGDVVPDEIKRFVRHSKALFLERHKTIKSLSEFKMMNLEQLRICMLAECREMQIIVDGRQSNNGNDIFSHFLYLYVSHMKSLRSIWEGPVPPRCFLGMLKSLVLQNCPELTTIFSMDFLGNLSLLKELIVRDCPKITTLISDGSFKHKGEVFLPKLRKIMLLHLPKLITISNGCYIGPSLNNIAIYDCPKLQSLSRLELSSQTLEVIKGEINWWNQLQWSKEEWGISQRPSKFECLFSSIDNQVDIMTQFGNDGDAIDDDAVGGIVSEPQQSSSATNFSLNNHFDVRTQFGVDDIDVSPVDEPLRPSNDDVVKDKKHSRRRCVGVTVCILFTSACKLITKIVLYFSNTNKQSESLEDGYAWRKYGQKEILGAKFPRSYFRCTHKYDEGCQAIKHVQRVDNEFVYRITYHADMTLPQTLFEHPKKSADSFSSVKQNADSVDFRVPSEVEVLDDGFRWKKYGHEIMDGSKNPRKDEAEMVPVYWFVTTESQQDDGFSWRKYGQKEILGSIYPRNYFRCTHRNLYGCLATKHVQRLDSNPNTFAVTYRGRHTCHLSSTGPCSSDPPQLIISRESHDITRNSVTPPSQLSSSNSVSSLSYFDDHCLFPSGNGSGVTSAGSEAGSTGPSTSNFAADYPVADMGDAMFNSGFSIGSNSMESFFPSIDEDGKQNDMPRHDG